MGLKILVSRKGVFFTASAIIILSFLLSYATINTQSSSTNSQSAQTNRLSATNQFVQNVEKDAAYATYTVGFRSLIGMIQFVEYNGYYLQKPVKTLVPEMFVNGTLDSSPVYVLENSTLTAWFLKIKSKANSIGLDFAYKINLIQVNQTDPWNVNFAIYCNVTFHDNKTNSTWVRPIVQTAQVSLIGFLDPLYIVETGNQFVHEINKTPYSANYVSGTNAANLIQHMQKGYYAAFDGAPNYLMRLAGNKSASLDGTGIESLVDKDALSYIIPVDATRSNADYIYFSTSNPAVYAFANMPSSFRLDNLTGGAQKHTQFYQLTP